MDQQKKIRPKVSRLLILACLLILNTFTFLLTLSIHQHIKASSLDAQTASRRDKPLPYAANLQGNIDNGGSDRAVPFITEDAFYQAYSKKYYASLPSLKKNTRTTDATCGEQPDYLEFFRLPKSQRSRLFEDKIIYDTFFKPTTAQASNAQMPLTYVELGAFDGKEESNTRFFDMCLGWDGLLIEAQSESYQKVIINRPNAVKLSFSPTCTDGMSKEGKQQTASFYNYPLSNNGMKDLAKSYTGKDTVEIPCGPLTPVLLDVFGPNQTISFFSLDVEGAETLVLDTLDFTKHDIHVMMIEIQNSYCPNPLSCSQTHMIRQRMAEANYSLLAELVEASDVYVKKGTDAWSRGMSVQEENAKRQWILKRKSLLKEKKLASPHQ